MNTRIPFCWFGGLLTMSFLFGHCQKATIQSKPIASVYTSQDTIRKMYQFLVAHKSSSRPFIAFVGNSITHGLSASVQENSYASILMRDIQDQQGTPYEPTITTDFRESDLLEGIDSITGPHYDSPGGPINTALRMTDKSQIYFHGIIDYLDIWIGDNSDIGNKLQFFRDGVLYRTVTVDKKEMYSTYNGITTLGNNRVEATPSIHKYSIKAIGQNTYIYGLIRSRKKLYDNAHNPFTFIREASSGWIIPYFLPVINTINTMSGDTLGQKGIFFIAVSINDMLSSTPIEYEKNLTTLLTSILSGGHFAIQIFPARAANHDLYDSFQTIAKEVCSRLKVPFLTLGNEDFIGNGWLSDGIHPTDIGHRYQAYMIENAMAQF